MYIYSTITTATEPSTTLPEGAVEHIVKLIEADDRRSFTVSFVTDASWGSEIPSTQAVIEGMLRDVAGITETSTFAAWAVANNRNPDSKNDERIFENLQRDSRRLRKFLGEAEYTRAVANVDEYVKNTLPNIIYAGPRPKGRPAKQTQPEEAANAVKGAVPSGKTSKGAAAVAKATKSVAPLTMEDVRAMVEKGIQDAVRAFTAPTKAAKPQAKGNASKPAAKKAPAKKSAKADAPVVVHSKKTK